MGIRPTLRLARPSGPIAFLGAWLVAYLAVLVGTSTAGLTVPLVLDLMYMPFRMTLTFILWQASKRSTDPQIARAWLLLAVGQAFAVIGNSTWVITDITGVDTSNMAYLGWTIPQSALTVAGFITMVRPREGRVARAGDWLDAAVLVVSAATIAWYFLAARLVVTGYDDATAVLLFFVDSTASAATVLLACMAWLRAPTGLAPGAMPRIAIAILMIVAGDLVLEAQLMQDTYRYGSPLDAWYAVAVFLYAIGADTQCRYRAGPASHSSGTRDHAEAIVLAAIGASLIPLVFEVSRREARPGALAVSAIGVVVLMLLMLWRQRIARHEIGVLIASRVAIEQQFWQAQKLDAVGRMAGGIAHDFNNVLTAISSHAQRLKDGEEAHVSGAAAEIQFSVDRAAALVRRLLAFSRADATERKRVVLGDVVASMEPMLRQLAMSDVALTFNVADDDAVVSLADGQLEQVLLNLTINARDATPAGGRITIGTRRETVGAGSTRKPATGSWAVLEVRDTGIGMDEDTRASIFKPFFTTRADAGGTGLGLATVAGIVRAAAGHVRVDSTVGAGTTMTVYLPLIADAAVAVHPATDPHATKPTGTILVVDDEVPIRAAVARYLKRHGYRVLEAANAEHALSLLAEHEWKVDLLLTDVRMPGITGVELSVRVLEHRPGLPVLFMTGFGEQQARPGGVAPPRDDTIAKPFDLSYVLARVEAKLRGDGR